MLVIVHVASSMLSNFIRGGGPRIDNVQKLFDYFGIVIRNRITGEILR